MTEEAFFSALADYNAEYRWVRAILTLAAIWLLIDLARKAFWAQVGLKLVFAFTCAAVGALYFGMFLPGMLPANIPEPFRTWSPRLWAVVFLVAAVAGTIDAAQDATHLRLPERGWRLAAVIGSAIVGLGFPAFDLLVGNVFPEAQAYGTSPAPLVLVVVPLLGASRPTRWTGRVWFSLLVLAGVDVGIFAPLVGLPYGHPIVLIAVLAGVIMMLRPGPTEPHRDG